MNIYKIQHINIFFSCSSLTIFFIALITSIQAQTIHFSDSLWSANNTAYKRIIGTIHDKNLVLFRNGSKELMQLLIYDSNFRIVDRKQLTFIQTTNAKIDLFCNTDNWDIIWQYFSNGKNSSFFARLNENGELLQIKPLGSSFLNTNIFSNNLSFQTIVSGNHKYYLSYIIQYDSGINKLIFHFSLINTQTSYQITSTANIEINLSLENVSNPFVDDEGSIYIAGYDNAKNYKLGSNIFTYKIDSSGKINSLPSFYIKEKKPQELFFFKQKNKLNIAALFTNFYSHHCEGVCCFSYDFTKSSWNNIAYLNFSRDFEKQVRKNIFSISKEVLMDQIRLRDFKIKNDSTCIFLLSLECYQHQNANAGNSIYDSTNFSGKRNEENKYDNINQSYVAKTVTGPGARDFQNESPLNFNAPQLLQNMKNVNDNLTGKSSAEYGDNLSSKLNPIINKTVILQTNFENDHFTYSMINSEFKDAQSIERPFIFSKGDTLFKLNYSITSNNKLKLHLTLTAFNITAKNILFPVNNNITYINETGVANLDKNYLLTFFENLNGDFVGLAKIHCPF